MRILFVHPAVSMSIGDVARGYRNALARQGHDIHDYSLGARFAYHMKALPKEMADNMQVLSRTASENILNEALYHNAEHVIIVSGLNLHPIALWLLGRVNIPVSVIFTESPYEDDNQLQWSNLDHVNSTVDLTIFTNDLYSANKYGWRYLPPCYDPALHKPMPFDTDLACDVMMVGTGWPERQVLLEAIDWTGIDLRLYGVWLNVVEGSPLYKFYRPNIIDNSHVASMYSNAKVCINFNRRSDTALTPGPRCYEIAASGGFQVADPRQGQSDMFGTNIPTFNTPAELERLIRFYIDPANELRRTFLARGARYAVQGHTFDQRAAELMAAIQPQQEFQGV